MPKKRQCFFTKTFAVRPGSTYSKQLTLTLPTIINRCTEYCTSAIISPEFTKRGCIHYHIYCSFDNDIDSLDFLKRMEKGGACNPQESRGTVPQVFTYLTKTSYVFKHYLDKIGITYNHDTIKINKPDTRRLLLECKNYNTENRDRVVYPLIPL